MRYDSRFTFIMRIISHLKKYVPENEGTLTIAQLGKITFLVPRNGNYG